MSLVPALGRQCLEDLCEFKASQGYTVRPCLTSKNWGLERWLSVQEHMLLLREVRGGSQLSVTPVPGGPTPSPATHIWRININAGKPFIHKNP